MKDIVAFLPGVMGSVLKLRNEVIWPGPPGSYVSHFPRMTELLSEDLEATDCIRKYYFLPQYQRLIDDLGTCGFFENDRTLVIVPYDWRRDIAISARTLSNYLDNEVAFHGADTTISLIGHSMGGLVSRYYLESGEFNTLPAYKCIRQLITLGTPHHGGPLALSAAIGRERRLFLSRDQVHQIASDIRYPSLYQILPPQTEPFVWDREEMKGFRKVDIYDPATAQKLGLVEENLAAAQQFHTALNIDRRPANVRYFCFAGTRQPTVTHCIIRLSETGRSIPDKVEEENGGDGTVPTWSSFVTGFQRMFVGGDHGTIYRNRELRRTLGVLLGKDELLEGVPDETEVALREKVVEPQGRVQLVISFPTEIVDFSGVLTIERVTINQKTGLVEGYSQPITTHPVEYSGLGLETMSLRVKAPSEQGVYRVSFRNDVDAQPSGFDELIVQGT